jgi:hypothetical protein
VNPAKIFFTSKFSYLLFFAIPPMKLKLKLGQQKGWGLLIGNHLDKSLWWTNQKYWAAVKSYLLCSFVQVQSVVAVPFTRHYKVYNYAEPKPFSWTKQPDFNLSSSNFTIQDHMLNTTGDALTTWEHQYGWTWKFGQYKVWVYLYATTWANRKNLEFFF